MELTRAPLHMLQNYEMDAKQLLELLGDIIAERSMAGLLQDIAKRPRGRTIPYARRRPEVGDRDRKSSGP